MHLESAYALSVDVVLDAEAELQQSSGAVDTLTQNKVEKLWICQYKEVLVI